MLSFELKIGMWWSNLIYFFAYEDGSQSKWEEKERWNSNFWKETFDFYFSSFLSSRWPFRYRYIFCVCFFLDMKAWWRNILIKFSSIKWFFFLIWIKITNSQQICVCDTFFSLSLSFFSSLTAHLFLSSWFTWQLTQKNLLSFIISCMFD